MTALFANAQDRDAQLDQSNRHSLIGAIGFLAPTISRFNTHWVPCSWWWCVILSMSSQRPCVASWPVFECIFCSFWQLSMWFDLITPWPGLFLAGADWVTWPELQWRGDMSAWASKCLFCFPLVFLRACFRPLRNAESTKRRGSKLGIKRKLSPCARKILTANSEWLLRSGLLLLYKQLSNPYCGPRMRKYFVWFAGSKKNSKMTISGLLFSGKETPKFALTTLIDTDVTK